MSAAAKPTREDRLLRIGLVINGIDFGGTESALAELALELGRRGHEVTVISLKTPGRIGRRLQEHGARVVSFDMPEQATFGGLVVATLRLRRWLSGQSLDVIQSFLPRANIVSRVANRFSGRRCLHISSERSTDHNRSGTVIRLNRLTARFTDHIVLLSEAVKKVMVERDRLPADRMTVIGNGIDVAGAESEPTAGLREQLGIAEDTVLLCSVGRLIPDKGHVYLIESLAALAPDTPRWELVLVGEGDEEAAIREALERTGLGSRVHLVGYRPDVLRIFKDVDVFLLPSLEEGIPVTVLEAMACSLPVVATRVGGNADLVVDGETGFLVTPVEDWQLTGEDKRRKNPAAIEELSERLHRLIGDEELRKTMSEAARERVDRFDLARVTDRLEALYRGGRATERYAGNNLLEAEGSHR